MTYLAKPIVLFLLAVASFGAFAQCSHTPGVPVSVTDCGADNTGATPSDQAFLDAITWASSPSNASQSVFIPCGNYAITSANLSIPTNGFSIAGEVGCRTTIQLGSSYQGIFIEAIDKGDLSIRNFRIFSASSSASTIAIRTTPPASGFANVVISGMRISGGGAALQVGTLDNSRISNGLFVSNTSISSTKSYSVILLNVSNFQFTQNQIDNWGDQNATSPGFDAINYDMNVDVSNWVISGNTFIAGPNTLHAISQGPSHPQKQINGLVVSKNTSTSLSTVSQGRGAGFALECSNCQIFNNTFENESGSYANGWLNCLEVYGTSSIEIAGNKCASGFLLTGPTVDGSNIDGLKIVGNTFTSKGSLPGNVMTCITLGSSAGQASPPLTTRTVASNIQVIGNICDATNAGTGEGVVSFQISSDQYRWGTLDNVLIADNIITQVAMNEAIRINEPLNLINKVRVVNNYAVQGFAVHGPTPTSSTSNLVFKNNFGGKSLIFENSNALGFIASGNF